MQPIHSKLAAWIDARMSRREFARKVRCHETHLSNVLQGKSGMSVDLALRIEDEVAGEFAAVQLLRGQKDRGEAQ